jgi:hypothetical protein
VTATEGGPALRGANAAVPAGNDGWPGVIAGSRTRRPVLSLARWEASLLIRSALVLTGLLAGGVTTWILIGPAEPLWWNAAWKLGFGQLVLGAAVLAAAQLAAGRARRNGMADLYASFPATAGTRTLGHLAGLAGAAPASLVLLGATAAVVTMRGAVGSPSVATLAGGLLLVIASGAVGVAIAARFPHPLAGLLGALALILSSGTNHIGSGAGIWLLPWEWSQDQLSSLVAPLAGYPPVGAHVLELAGLAALAAAIALAATASRARARAGLATCGVAALAVICLAGVLQLRPIPTAELNHLVSGAANPASVQRCTTASGVRYCLYPGFSRQLPSLAAPVSAVLAHVPVRPGQPLTVMQVSSLYLPDSTLTHGHPRRQVSRWEAQLQQAPGTTASVSHIYLPVGSWPAVGGQLADARFDVALAAAQWALRIPVQAIGNPTTGPVYLPCVAVDQAREAIAIWLAILATHPPAGELQAGLTAPAGRPLVFRVSTGLVSVWNYPGWAGSYLAPAQPGPQTAAGYLLASAMMRLPEERVAHVVAAGWRRWLDVRTTDAELAAALGIPMPSVPVPQLPGAGGRARAVVRAVNTGPGGGPGAPDVPNPVCTS